MKYKLISGLIILAIGIVLLIYGFYGVYRMTEARGKIDTATSYIPEKRVKGFVKERLYGEVDKYKLPVTLCFIGGVVFIVVGGTLIYLSRRKK